MGPGERGSGEHSVHDEEGVAGDTDQDQTGKGSWKIREFLKYKENVHIACCKESSKNTTNFTWR